MTTIRKVAATLAVLASVSLLAACGSNGNSSDTEASSDLVPLTVVIPNASPNVAQPVIGVESGIFERLGLDVEVLISGGANTTALVLSGQADIGLFGVPSVLQTVKQGKPMSIIYGALDVVPTQVFAGRSGINSLDEVEPGNCTMAVGTVGSTNYGMGLALNEAAGINCKLVPFASTAASAAAVASGQVDIAEASFQYFSEMLDEKKVNLLVDTRDPEIAKKYFGESYTTTVLFGQTSVLQSKQASVVKFIEGMLEVDKLLTEENSAKIAGWLHQEEKFQTQSVSAIARQVEDSLPTFTPEAGYVSESNWTRGLEQIASYGIANYSPTDPAYAYSEIIDMSYYLSAGGSRQ